jgi:hypothetical protein
MWHEWGEEECVYVIGEKPEGNRPLGRPRCGWVCNIGMHLGEVGWGGVDWIDLVQYREKWGSLVNAVMNLRVP